jgi:hypothetical protein
MSYLPYTYSVAHFARPQNGFPYGIACYHARTPARCRRGSTSSQKYGAIGAEQADFEGVAAIHRVSIGKPSGAGMVGDGGRQHGRCSLGRAGLIEGPVAQRGCRNLTKSQP